MHNTKNPPNLIHLSEKKTKEQENQGSDRKPTKCVTVHSWKQKVRFSWWNVVYAYTFRTSWAGTPASQCAPLPKNCALPRAQSGEQWRRGPSLPVVCQAQTTGNHVWRDKRKQVKEGQEAATVEILLSEWIYFLALFWKSFLSILPGSWMHQDLDLGLPEFWARGLQWTGL